MQVIASKGNVNNDELL